ncbi:hypothetical protein L596_015689 [Steinernema carpocapsae]|uniref:TOG domain-containing protein n=1 Tax=Steinernema carpocapsae TaxID=34508 RepID=A0A4U5NFQ1_STECR|nr:hypothetical protein L596_015689 [Steinernema carpocapsae]
MELMVSICEGMPKYMRKHGKQYIPEILNKCLLLMSQLDDETEEWLVCDDADAEDDEETAGVGETALDRVACALGGKVCLNHFIDLVQPMLANKDQWKVRHAAIMGFSTVGEGLKRQMEPMIKQVIEEILPYVEDPHPRVKYAACNASVRCRLTSLRHCRSCAMRRSSPRFCRSWKSSRCPVSPPTLELPWSTSAKIAPSPSSRSTSRSSCTSLSWFSRKRSSCWTTERRSF